MRFPDEVRGFTLIEVLVVVVIVGIVSAAVLLSFGLIGDDRSLQREARRLSSLIELASDEALMQGRDFGLEFTRTGYRFLEFDPLSNRWYEVPGDDQLRARDLEEPLELALRLDDRAVELRQRFAAVKKDGDGKETAGALDEKYAPHLLVLSSGDVTPFDLRIIRPTDRSEIVVTMAATGEMEIQTTAEALR